MKVRDFAVKITVWNESLLKTYFENEVDVNVKICFQREASSPQIWGKASLEMHLI